MGRICGVRKHFKEDDDNYDRFKILIIGSTWTLFLSFKIIGGNSSNFIDRHKLTKVWFIQGTFDPSWNLHSSLFVECSHILASRHVSSYALTNWFSRPQGHVQVIVKAPGVNAPELRYRSEVPKFSWFPRLSVF